jgi:hypothetical protein
MLPRRARRAPPLGDQFAGNKAGHRQDQHQRLKGGDVEFRGRGQLDAENEAKLRRQDADAHPFRAGADRKPDDRQKQDVKELELLVLRQPEDQQQREADRGELQQRFARHRQHAPARQREQRNRRDHGDADHVADPVVRRGGKEIPRRQLAGRDREADIAERHDRGAGDCGSRQQHEVAHRGERGIEAQGRPQQNRERDRIAAADQQRCRDFRGPRHRQLLVEEIGEQRAHQQERKHPEAEQQQQREAQSGARVPRRDAEVRVGPDEADPVERRIGGEIDRPDEQFARAKYTRGSHRSHSLRRRPVGHHSKPSARADPGY